MTSLLTRATTSASAAAGLACARTLGPGSAASDANATTAKINRIPKVATEA